MKFALMEYTLVPSYGVPIYGIGSKTATWLLATMVVAVACLTMGLPRVKMDSIDSSHHSHEAARVVAFQVGVAGNRLPGWGSCALIRWYHWKQVIARLGLARIRDLETLRPLS